MRIAVEFGFSWLVSWAILAFTDAYQLLAQVTAEPVPEWVSKLGSTGVLSGVIWFLLKDQGAKIDKLTEAITDLRVSIAGREKE